MSATDDKLAALLAAVQRTSTDVQAILDRLKTTGLSDQQTAILDQANSALGDLDDAMEQAAGGAVPHPGAPHKGGPHR